MAACEESPHRQTGWDHWSAGLSVQALLGGGIAYQCCAPRRVPVVMQGPIRPSGADAGALNEASNFYQARTERRLDEGRAANSFALRLNRLFKNDDIAPVDIRWWKHREKTKG